MMIFLVRLEMAGKRVYPLRQKCDLNAWRAGILLVCFVYCYDFGLNDYGGHGFIVGFHDCREPLRAPWRPLLPIGNRVEPASPFQSGGVPDQSW